MRKCYTRPCNFYYGNYASKLIEKKKALPLGGNSRIAFDKLEIFQRKGKRSIKSDFYSIHQIKSIKKTILPTVRDDIKKITSRKNGSYHVLWILK